MVRISTTCRAIRAALPLRRESWTIPAELPMGDSVVVPLNGGESINWKLV